MKALHTNSSTLTRRVSAKRLFNLERQGKFETALKEISQNSLDVASIPDTSGLDDRDAAELLLRFAALAGFYGHSRQIAESQKIAKDILTDLSRQFENLGNTEKVVECENYIALCYWRTGELNEALVWAESALSRSTKVFDARMYAYVTRSLVYHSLQRYADNIRDCEHVGPMLFAFGNAFLTGSYCANIGLSFKNAGRLDDALRYLELARDYHIKSKHQIYLGSAENNLAQLYKSKGYTARAHASVDAAIRAFRQAKDRTREGCSIDTKALIYHSQGELEMSLRTSDAAIRILRKGENSAYLVECLQTKSRTQLFLNDVSGAVATLNEAMEIARVQIGEDCAGRMFDEFVAAANERSAADNVSTPTCEKLATEENLQLVLPGSLSRYSDYQGLWINNSHLELLGLTKGSLAVIVRDEIKRGDLVAITEIENDMVSCGFYDEDFGIVCLEGVNTEPQLFDSGAVRVLGKIVGVCSGRPGEDGKMIVEPLPR